MTDVRELWVSARAPRPDARLDVYGALGATALAALVYVGALWSRILPPQGFSVVMFAGAPILAAVAAPVVVVRARAERDEPLAWFGAGLVVALVGMVLHLVTFPAVTGPGGGPLGTTNTSSAQLFLVYHLALPLAVAAATLGVPARARSWFVAAGAALAVAAAANLIPSPELITSDLRFTPALIGVEIVLAALLGAAALVWIRRAGRSARPLRGWAGVALSLSCYEVLLGAVAAERFQPLWWASLSLRLATYAVLAVGAVATVLAGLRRLERYTDSELDRSDAELLRSATVTERLLSNALALSRATTVREVAEALVTACQEATGLSRVSALVVDDASGRMHSVVRRGYDSVSTKALQEYPTASPMPGAEALRAGRPLWFATHAELWERFPDLLDLPVHRRTSALAVLPLVAAGAPVGVLTLSGDEPRSWEPVERELLVGLATQAGQALARATLFEQQRSTAEVLQQGLLPQRLPDVAGVRLAARYVAGAAGAAIGGDWYDCVPLPDSRVVLVVGDVMGKGVRAAARMAEVRQAVRVLVSIDPAPSAVLTALDAFPAEGDPDEIVTFVFVLLDPVSGTVRLARAGHVPPALAGPAGSDTGSDSGSDSGSDTGSDTGSDSGEKRVGGRAVLLECGASPPLGVPPVPRPEALVPIVAGSTLVLFTDGLVEDRRTGLDPGLPDLLDTIDRLTAEHDDVEDVADGLLAARRRRGAPSDDTCLLVVRLEPAAGSPPG